MVTEIRDRSVEAVVAILELIGSEHPQLLDFQLDTLIHSTTRFAVHELASAFAVRVPQVGQAIHRACLGLDTLERRRARWKDPALVLQSPNIVALLHVCRARAARVADRYRRRKLEIIERRLQAARELARSRKWIEEFIGAPVGGRAVTARPDN